MMEQRGKFEGTIQAAIAEYRQQRELRQQHRRLEIPRWILVALILITSVFVWKGITCYQYWQRWRIMHQFVEAVEHGQGEILFALVTPEDYKRLKLTPEKARKVVQTLFGNPSTGVKVSHITAIPRGERDAYPEDVNWRVFWSDASTGRPLPAKRIGHHQLCAFVTIKPTPAGLRVDFQGFLTGIAMSRWGVEQGRLKLVQVYRHVGL